MAKTILLYGATGYSGRLIANEARRLQDANAIGVRMVLAARNRQALADLAHERGMEARAFALNDRDQIVRQLQGIDVVLNAAGPFSATASRLATAALEARCHYVDINGEMDVYRRLDDYASYADDRNVCMVCSAGFTAAASSLLLEEALVKLATRDPPIKQLGAIRFAMSALDGFSRGGASTMWRSLREQVTVVRSTTGSANDPALWHSPVAKLERSVDFTPPEKSRASSRDGPTTPLRDRHRRIAMAANLVDTLTARLTASHRDVSVRDIESYIEVNSAERLAYPIATLGTPFLTTRLVRKVAGLAINMLPDGPTQQERSRDRQTLLLSIEDPLQRRVIDWCISTPNTYDFSARVALAIAQRVASVGHAEHGWKTPGQILHAAKCSLLRLHKDGPLRECEFVDRLKMEGQRA